MQSPRAPRSGTLAWGARGVCAIGPSPAIPSGLGHKYQCPWGLEEVQFPPLWRDHKSRPSQSKSVTSLRRLRMAGMCWCPLPVGMPKALVGSTGRGRNHPTQPQLPRILRAARYSGHQVPGCPLPCSVGLSPRGGCLVRHLHLSLPS